MQPACGNCVKAGRDCTIQDPSSKRQLPPNYIEVLETRIAELEGLLSKVHPDIASDHISASTRQHVVFEAESHVSGSTQNSPNGSDIENLHDEASRSSSQNLTDDLATLCASAASGQMLYFGETSGPALSKILTTIMNGARLQAPGLTLSGARNSPWHELPKAIPASLPEPVFGSLLVDAYFTHVHPQYPFLHRPTFVYWESQVQAALRQGHTPDPGQYFFVFMVNAIGALITPVLSPSSAESLYASAESLLDQILVSESLESIQALLCCAMYSMRATTGVSVWTLSGIALRQCTDLGLHRKTARASTSASVLETQLRRRVFWVAYNLDRIAAISTGRPFGISEEDIDAEYPEDLNDEEITETHLLAKPRTDHKDPPTVMSLAIHNLRLRRIWAEMKSTVYVTHMPSSPQRQVTSELKVRLQTWLAQCPPAIASASICIAPYGSMKWYQLTYHHSVILLNRQSLVSHSKEKYQ